MPKLIIGLCSSSVGFTHNTFYVRDLIIFSNKQYQTLRHKNAIKTCHHCFLNEKSIQRHRVPWKGILRVQSISPPVENFVRHWQPRVLPTDIGAQYTPGFSRGGIACGVAPPIILLLIIHSASLCVWTILRRYPSLTSNCPAKVIITQFDTCCLYTMCTYCFIYIVVS